MTDPSRVFNSSLDGNVRRAIDIKEGEVDEKAFQVLVLQAVALNASKAKARQTARQGLTPR